MGGAGLWFWLGFRVGGDWVYMVIVVPSFRVVAL